MKNIMLTVFMIGSIVIFGQDTKKMYNVNNFDEKIMDSLFNVKINYIRKSNNLSPLIFNKICFLLSKTTSAEFSKNVDLHEFNYENILDSIYNEHQILNNERKSLIRDFTISTLRFPDINESYEKTIDEFFIYDKELHDICLDKELSPETYYAIGVKFEMVDKFYQMTYSLVMME